MTCQNCGNQGEPCCPANSCNGSLHCFGSAPGNCDVVDMAMPPSDMSVADHVLTWAVSTSFDAGVFYSVYGSAGVVFAVGDKGSSNPIWKKPFSGSALQFSVDSGNSFTTNTLRSVWGTSKTQVYAVGDNGTILNQTGGAWAGTVGSGLPSYPLNGVWIGLPGSPAIWTVGGSQAGSCADTMDVGHFDGSAWETPESSASACAMGAVWSDGAGVVVLGANVNHIELTSTTIANHSVYQLDQTTNAYYIHGVWGTASNNVYLVGDNGRIYHLDYNGGFPISALQSTGTTVNLRGVHGSGPNDLWAVGGNQVLHSTGDGNWVVQKNLPNNTSDLYGVYALSAGDVYVVGTTMAGEKTIMHGGP
jgi:hypothetical protein